MSDGRSYRFASPAQLAACLRMPLPAAARLALDPARATAFPGESLIALAAGRAPHFAWVGSDGILRREPGCDGPALGPVMRLVESGTRLWALAGDALSLIDGASLQPIETIAVPGASDICSDGHGGVWVLTQRRLLHFERNGAARARDTIGLDRRYAAVARAGGGLALLDRDREMLALRRTDGSWIQLELSDFADAAGAAFSAETLSDNGELLLLGGDWGGEPGFLALSVEGDPLCFGAWDGPAPRAQAAQGGGLLAVFEGSWQYFERALEPAGERLLTPVLESDTLGASWQRAELCATLPRGATASIRWAATREDGDVSTAASEFVNRAKPPGQRFAQLGRLLPWRGESVTYLADPAAEPSTAATYTAPLAQAQGNYLWIEATLHRNGADIAPSVGQLVVQHDGRGLGDYLPAVFQTPDGDRDGTLRRLLAVFEATCYDFDARIAGMAARLDPVRSEAHWLPDLAALLGLPFDDALDLAQQRRLVQAAFAIHSGRGTRAGIRALLTALFGDRPYRIADRTSRLLPIAVGGGSFTGSALPALLAGPSRRTPKLNARLVLGKTALCEVSPCDEAELGRGPEVLVVIPASDAEKRRLGAAVRQMVEAMVPAGVRLSLRWIGLEQAAAGDVLAVAGNVPRVALGGVRALGAAALGGTGARLGEGGVAAAQRLD